MLRLWHGTVLFNRQGNAGDKFGNAIGQPEASERHSRENIALEWQGNEEQDGGYLGQPCQEKDEQGQRFGAEEVHRREKKSNER